MFFSIFSFIAVTCQEFVVTSLESALVCAVVHLTYTSFLRRRTMDTVQNEDLDLSELPDCYALPDDSKTARIRSLERQVGITFPTSHRRHGDHSCGPIFVASTTEYKSQDPCTSYWPPKG